MKKMSFLFAGFLFLAVFASCTLQNQNSSVSFCFPSDTSEHLAAYRSTISGLQLSEQEPGGDDPVVKYYVDFVVNGETSSDFHKEFDSEEEINGYKLEINNLKAGTIATVGVEVGYGERAFFRGQSDILLHAGDNSAVIKLKAAEELEHFNIEGHYQSNLYSTYKNNSGIPLWDENFIIYCDSAYDKDETPAKWTLNGHPIESTFNPVEIKSYFVSGLNTIECTVHHEIFVNFKRTEKFVFTVAGDLEVGVNGIIPEYSIRSDSSFRSSGTGTFTLVTEDGKSFSNGTTYNWYLNNHLLDSSDFGVSIEGSKCFVELSKYEYVDETNTILCIAMYNGKYRSYSTNFDILDYEHSALYYNHYQEANPDYYWGRVPHNTETGGVTAPTPATPYGSRSDNTYLMAYCYDPDGDLYVSIKDESVNKIEKYPYNKSEQAYTDEKTTLWGASTHTPVRIATDGNYVYFVSATDSYNFSSTYTENVYYVSAKNSSDSPNSIRLNEDFSSITAVGVWAGKLYVGGKSANNTTLETKFKVGIGGACTSETVTVYTYKVMSYDIKPDGTIDTATKEQYVSYSEGALVKTLDLDDLGSTNPVEVSRPWADKVVKAGFVISDIVADYDNVYVLFSYNASNEYNVYGNSEGAEGQNPISSIGGFISYIENGSKKTITITGDIPSSLPYNESVKYYAPTRILAVKPKELIIADGNGDRNALFETVSLENKSVTVNRYGYGYQFDGAVNTSIEQFYNVETHEIDYINSDLSGTERQ